MTSVEDRYSSVAIALHWAMAIAIVLMLGTGLVMDSDLLERSSKFALIQWHKSLGVFVLLAALFRLGWRLLHKPPLLPFVGWEKQAAHLGHWGLYACMLLMPLSGWLMVSSSVYGLPTIVFGWFKWPHIPGLAGNETVSDLAGGTHSVVAWTLIAFIVVHVAAVIKHLIVDKHNILPRMWWTMKKEVNR